MATTSDVRASIIDAALKLAENQGWRRVTLAAIAAESGEPLSRVYAEFPAKEAILTGFARRIDAAILTEPPEAAGSVRDRLFDLLMRRFDALAPHRAAIRVAGADPPVGPVRQPAADRGLGLRRRQPVCRLPRSDRQRQLLLQRVADARHADHLLAAARRRGDPWPADDDVPGQGQQVPSVRQ